MKLYLLLNLGSIALPLLFSFHPKIQFNKEWKYLFPALTFTAIPFLLWDVWFAKAGYWGFNPEYLLGVYLFDLPLEEWMFFFCIPYACLFTMYTMNKNLKDFKFSNQATRLITVAILLIGSILGITFFDRSYTAVNYLFAVMILAITWKAQPQILNSYYVGYLVILLPFLIVNGLLTGSFIKDEVVWYNNLENLNYRVATIPIEDFTYAFTMLLLPCLIISMLKKRY
ncbi:MAG: lycopene cyclase domain-containing protein [Reichenbachiella sp.]|uniref:lycopene cyclase domain-containing protein n=1 Tax=Reichenbachiella sp. TaxID=2184521 RepID=UPI0032991ADB